MFLKLYDIIGNGVPMTGWQPLEFMICEKNLKKFISVPKREYIEGEVALMTAYEVISIILAMISLLIAFGMFLVALFAFFDKRNKQK